MSIVEEGCSPEEFGRSSTLDSVRHEIDELDRGMALDAITFIGSMSAGSSVELLGGTPVESLAAATLAGIALYNLGGSFIDQIRARTSRT